MLCLFYLCISQPVRLVQTLRKKTTSILSAKEMVEFLSMAKTLGKTVEAIHVKKLLRPPPPPPLVYMNRNVRKVPSNRNVRKRTFEQQHQDRTFKNVRPAKILIRLHVCQVWSESSIGTFRIAKDAKIFHADMKTIQTVQMRRLIWVSFFARGGVYISKGSFSHVMDYAVLFIFSSLEE